MDTTQLDRLQREYHEAVERWIDSIRNESKLASGADHSVVKLDEWENATFEQERLAGTVKTAKKAYEDGIRRAFYGF